MPDTFSGSLEAKPSACNLGLTSQISPLQTFRLKPFTQRSRHSGDSFWGLQGQPLRASQHLIFSAEVVIQAMRSSMAAVSSPEGLWHDFGSGLGQCLILSHFLSLVVQPSLTPCQVSISFKKYFSTETSQNLILLLTKKELD